LSGAEIAAAAAADPIANRMFCSTELICRVPNGLLIVLPLGLSIGTVISFPRRMTRASFASYSWNCYFVPEGAVVVVPVAGCDEPMDQLMGGGSELFWVALKALLLYVTAIGGFRLGERRTLAEMSAFDFVAAVAVGAIVGRVPNSSTTS